MGVSESKISRNLDLIVEKAETCRPIRFLLPILTKLQYEVYVAIAELGMTLEETALYLDTTTGSVRDTLHKIRKNGLPVQPQTEFMGSCGAHKKWFFGGRSGVNGNTAF